MGSQPPVDAFVLRRTRGATITFPVAISIVSVLVISQVVLGYIILGLLVSVLADKVARRS